MEFTSKQDQALSAVSEWLKNGFDENRPYFKLFGYAGTGKTTLARHFALGLDGAVAFGAFTGKAAHVLQQKGCEGATTIHKLIYKPKEKSRMRLVELEQDLHELILELRRDDPTITDEAIEKNKTVVQLKWEIQNEMTNLRKPSWSLNEESPIINAPLVIIDECSMVSGKMADDMMSFKRPILVLGDPAQLPPIGGEGFFTKGDPDIMLTEIRRQEADNPIIAMATAVREGRELRHGQYGTSKVIDKTQIDRAELMAYDQVLVGLNKSRKNYNFRIRQLKGFNDPLPMKGDRLVCLRNNHELGLLNGSLWRVQSTAQLDKISIELHLEGTDNDNQLVCSAHSAYFFGEEPAYYEMKDHECFDFGSALTVHKSQGSQWDRVYIFDESYAFRQDRRKHLYTAITRAAKEVTIVL